MKLIYEGKVIYLQITKKVSNDVLEMVTTRRYTTYITLTDWSSLCSSDKLFRIHDFFSEKIILGPQEGEIPPPLAQMVLTQCISISELLVYHRAPPGGQI